MRFKTLMCAALIATSPALAQKTGVMGTALNAADGSPLQGTTVMLRDQGLMGQTGISGEFRFSNAAPGEDFLIIMAPDGSVTGFPVVIADGKIQDMGALRVAMSTEGEAEADQRQVYQDFIFDESVLDDDEGSGLNIAALTGANDNVYYNTASYNFGPMYFRFRGYDSEYQSVYLNGIKMNDLVRGRFSFNTFLGMTSRAFRNKTTTIGIAASDYGFGSIGGSTNYNTETQLYSPGFNGSAAYTNSNYYARLMATYSTGLNRQGWAFTVSAIGRYSDEGVVEGTFYNSGGLFMSLEKVINKNHSVFLTAFGGPTQRANGSATYNEAYDLADTKLYNPNWGYQTEPDGSRKKRASRIVETFDPTVMLNWFYKNGNTTVNTAATVHWNLYSSSALNWYKANDPNPTYYRYLPSYYYSDGAPTMQSDLITNLWHHDVNTRQINWDGLYQVNYLNNVANEGKPAAERQGSSYILENRVSNQFVFAVGSNLNHRLNDHISMQAGVTLNMTKGTYYKTIRDLMGGEYWLDIDPFSDRDIALNPTLLQNNLDDPNRRVGKGDKFGYYYDINALQLTGYLQNTITLPRWDINYGVEMTYTQFQRDGKWRNGRNPNNSLGKGAMHNFDDAAAKAGVTFKLDGHNFFVGHLQYGTRAPLIDDAYISPRIEDNSPANLSSERVLAGDISYVWNYRRFRGTLTAYATDMRNGTDRMSFYDDRYATYTNFVLSNVRKSYKGFELGMTYNITSSLAATFAGTYARYQYKNNPKGYRSIENGLQPDTTATVYLKNYYLGSVPQTVMNIGLDWQAPKNWFFNVNATWQGDAYVNLSPVHHEAMPELLGAVGDISKLEEKIRELSRQDKLHSGWSLNLSIGKALYLRKCSINFNVNVNNVLNNREIATYAYQQSRVDTKNWSRDTYPNKYTYCQGIRIFANVGVRF